LRKIAGDLGVSEATVRSRYRRLCAGNIMQVVGVTNPLELGFEAIAMLGIRVSGSPAVAGAEIAEWPEATYVVLVAGQFDLLVELVCVDRNHLLDVIGRIRSLDGVVSAEAFVYLSLVKQLYSWGTRDAGPARADERPQAVPQVRRRTRKARRPTDAIPARPAASRPRSRAKSYIEEGG
jgi:Lrp/AsnC family transcriptional regulator for asnA, asnC and gidA